MADKTKQCLAQISTENENTLWQVFSVYKIKNTNDYLKINTDKEFLDKLQKRSAYKFETSVSENDQILTLSTCYNNNEKMVNLKNLEKSVTKMRFACYLLTELMFFIILFL